MRKVLGLAGVAIIVLTSCSSGTKTTTSATPAAINVTAVNYAFTAPSTVAAGAVSVTLKNSGKEAHQAQLFKLNNGVDVGALVTAAKAQAPDLALSNHLTIIAASALRSSRLATRILIELANLFFQRHLSNQRLNASICARIGESGIRHLLGCGSYAQ